MNRFLRRKNALKVSVYEFVKPTQTIDKAFAPLSRESKNSIVDFYIECNGKKYYSFETEDEMYITFCGLKKYEYLRYERYANKTDDQLLRQLKKYELKMYNCMYEGENSLFEKAKYIFNSENFDKFIENINRKSLYYKQKVSKMIDLALMGEIEELNKFYSEIDSHGLQGRIEMAGLLSGSNIFNLFRESVLKDVINYTEKDLGKFKDIVEKFDKIQTNAKHNPTTVAQIEEKIGLKYTPDDFAHKKADRKLQSNDNAEFQFKI